METIISFFKRRWWSFVPLLVCLCVLSIIVLIWHLQQYPDGNAPVYTLGLLVLFSLPATIPLLFVRRRLFNLWYPVALAYLVLGTIFLLGQNSTSGGLPISISEQFVYAVDLAIAFFVVTFLWSIIHTIILRYNEKKANQAVVK